MWASLAVAEAASVAADRVDIVVVVHPLDNTVAAVASLVRFAAVDIACTLVAVADLDHSTTWIAPSLFSHSRYMHFDVLYSTTINAQNVTFDKKEALYLPCKEWPLRKTGKK